MNPHSWLDNTCFSSMSQSLNLSFQIEQPICDCLVLENYKVNSHKAVLVLDRVRTSDTGVVPVHALKVLYHSFPLKPQVGSHVLHVRSFGTVTSSVSSVSSESPGGVWEGRRHSQAEGVPAGRVSRRRVATHQRRLRLLDLHRTLVQLGGLLKVALLIAGGN